MPYFDVKEILSAAITIIDAHGYKSSKESGIPTWKLVDQYIQEHLATDLDEDFINHTNIKIRDEAINIIKEVLNHSPKTQYMSTVKEVIERGYCGKHLFGLIISFIPIYRRRRLNI